MRFRLGVPALTLVFLVAFPMTMRAQTQGSVELGFDAGFEVWMPDDEFAEDLFTASIPAGGAWVFSPQGIRIGYWASETVAFEFPVGFSMVSSDGETVWGIGLGAYTVFNLTTGPGAVPFGRFGIGYTLLDGGFFEAGEDSQWSLGGGIGVRVPIAPQLALRFGAGLERTLPGGEDANVDGHWDLQFGAGVSFFTSRPSGS